jgi:uncharacterized protein with PIN domain
LPAEEVYVFDACAVVALLQGEEGASVASGLLLEESHRCLVPAINVCEVYYDLFRRDGEEIADGVREVLEGYGFEVVEDLPFSLWKTAGKLKGTWKRISLADCFALALALETSATLVTSDHHEMDSLAQAGVCPIRFIR